MSEQRQSEQQLRAALAAAKADVLGTIEKGKNIPSAELQELRRTVDDALNACASFMAAAPEAERSKLELTLGRQVIDLKRAVALLPQMVSGKRAQTSPDFLPGGRQPFLETRAPGRSLHGNETPARRRDEPKGAKPGDEIEAWCGPCDGMRSHHIFAVVDGHPKQVVCQSCGARHGYRTTPARARSREQDDERASATANANYKAQKAKEREQEQRRQQERDRMKNELAAAENVVAYEPRQRYKAGQVVEHPEYGRGKIENVLRSSMLVRFPVGLKSLTLK